ncbi:MAG: inositol-3-phosphate synthase [Candidatus Bathyarchaeota archaeon]|nr:MAG: inositol-3-phosphate synthase [Candidatus Bathyarchaeota archaeon]
MRRIRVAVAGVGNCCSALVQGVEYYNGNGMVGLIHEEVGGYAVSDIEFVAAFDVDSRKVGRDLSQAIFSEPNKTPRIVEPSLLGVEVQMGPPLDTFENTGEALVEVAEEKAVDVSRVLKDRGVDVLVNLVSGSATESSKYYAEAALDAGCAFLNAAPAPIVTEERIASMYSSAGVPLVGDDLLDQIGATVAHIGLLEFLHRRGVRIDESYQLDVGGGAESVNTLWKTRGLKRDIKTSAVSGSVPYEFPLVSGSTDYVDFLENRRDSFFWFKGSYFGDAPFTMDVKLNTVDAPNAGAILLDVIRGLKIARSRGLGGPILPLCAYGFKRPPERHSLVEAYSLFRGFVEE